MDNTIQVWISEFSELTKQQISRHRFQQAIIALNISSMTTVLGITLNNPGWWDIKMLLIVPFVTSMLAFYYLHQEFQIAAIGLYIRDYIRTKVMKLTNDKDILGWENWVREYKRNFAEPLVFSLSIPALHIVPSIIALVATYKNVFGDNGWIVAVWIMGSVLTILTIICWFSWHSQWLGSLSKGVQESKSPESG